MLLQRAVITGPHFVEVIESPLRSAGGIQEEEDSLNALGLEGYCLMHLVYNNASELTLPLPLANSNAKVPAGLLCPITYNGFWSLAP
jgi:hypothetical protein